MDHLPTLARSEQKPSAPALKCAFCPGAASEFTCRRCDNPLCESHVPLSGRRCEACEYDYESRRTKVKTVWWSVILFLAMLPIVFLLANDILDLPLLGAKRDYSTGNSIVDSVIIAAVAGVVGKLLSGLRVMALRRTFLKEYGEPNSLLESAAENLAGSRE